MKTPKTVKLIECRKCSGTYYAGDQKVTLSPGDETELPDEISIMVRKIGACTSCQERENRTNGGQRKRFER